MSFSDTAADVQPDQGQGEGGGGGSPWADVLDRIPEGDRSFAEQRFREWDGNYTRSQQEAAEFRKQWEPYQNLGISQMQPDEVQWALQVAQAAQNNPQALREWLDQTHPVTPEPAQDLGSYDQYDPNAQLMQRLEQLEQQLQQGNMRWQEFEQQTQQARDAQIMEAEVAALKEAHGSELPPKVLEQFEDLIVAFGHQHAQPGVDPKQVVAKAWATLQPIVNAIEANALNRKVNDPNPAEGGGVPDVSPEKVGYGKPTEARARQMLEAWNRQARGQ